jgi:hypothetical protein
VPKEWAITIFFFSRIQAITILEQAKTEEMEAAD